jgi:hypothetical protein
MTCGRRALRLRPSTGRVEMARTCLRILTATTLFAVEAVQVSLNRPRSAPAGARFSTIAFVPEPPGLGPE